MVIIGLKSICQSISYYPLTVSLPLLLSHPLALLLLLHLLFINLALFMGKNFSKKNKDLTKKNEQRNGVEQEKSGVDFLGFLQRSWMFFFSLNRPYWFNEFMGWGAMIEWTRQSFLVNVHLFFPTTHYQSFAFFFLLRLFLNCFSLFLLTTEWAWKICTFCAFFDLNLFFENVGF